jgi:isoleucyl-tRNA synthetase
VSCAIAGCSITRSNTAMTIRSVRGAEDDALIQYARKSWFVRTSQFKDEFLENNDQIKWLPEHIKEGRFGDFLRNNVDWALSRERFWGTPLPVWVCDKNRPDGSDWLDG